MAQYFLSPNINFSWNMKRIFHLISSNQFLMILLKLVKSSQFIRSNTKNVVKIKKMFAIQPNVQYLRIVLNVQALYCGIQFTAARGLAFQGHPDIPRLSSSLFYWRRSKRLQHIKLYLPAGSWIRDKYILERHLKFQPAGVQPCYTRLTGRDSLFQIQNLF